MAIEQAMEVDCADNIHVVKNERLIQAVGILEKEPACLFQAAAGVEQELFARNFHLEAEIVVGFQILNHQVGEVVHVDDDFAHAECSKAGERQLQ